MYVKQERNLVTVNEDLNAKIESFFWVCDSGHFQQVTLQKNLITSSLSNRDFSELRNSSLSFCSGLLVSRVDWPRIKDLPCGRPNVEVFVQRPPSPTPNFDSEELRIDTNPATAGLAHLLFYDSLLFTELRGLTLL